MCVCVCDVFYDEGREWKRRWIVHTRNTAEKLLYSRQGYDGGDGSGGGGGEGGVRLQLLPHALHVPFS